MARHEWQKQRKIGILIDINTCVCVCVCLWRWLDFSGTSICRPASKQASKRAMKRINLPWQSESKGKAKSNCTRNFPSSVKLDLCSVPFPFKLHAATICVVYVLWLCAMKAKHRENFFITQLET